MERLNINQARLEELRLTQSVPLPDYAEPLPGTALKLDDDVMWLEFAPMRVVWGIDDPGRFQGYSPDIFGDLLVSVEGQYINDRAPADPEETPMPIYPQQAQQRQPAGQKKHDPKRALQDLLKQLTPEYQQKVRALVREKRPELLDEAHP